MLTGELRSQIDRIWDAFWSGGISNPLEVIEQITYLLFIRRLDDLHTLEENKARTLKLKKLERPIFPEGKDDHPRTPRPYADYRWSRFKHFAPADLFTVVGQHVFPFLQQLGGDGSTYAHHMKDARFTIPTPALLAKVVDLIDQVPMADRDTKGDLYEYMLGKIASAGQNGQFRTPRHIIQLMVELTAPAPGDIIVDPACGTAGFLVAASEFLRTHHPAVLTDAKLKKHFHTRAFHGFDFDSTMLRIGSMNMLLHGVENPAIRYRDSLAQDHAGEEETYTLVLANPPFAGSLDYENCAKDLQAIVKTKKTELLFLALFLRLLKPGGRAAVIVPDGVLFGSSNAHQQLRKILVEEQKLDAVISLPGGVFKPYAGVSTAILLFTKTNSGGTDHVWFYDLDADGWSLDDKRTPLLPEEKFGPVPKVKLTVDEHAKNNLPDLLTRWRALRPSFNFQPSTFNFQLGRRSRPSTHRPILPRSDFRHPRSKLRPLAQPLQGSHPRGSRPPPPAANPRRPRQAGKGNRGWDEGAGGDAEVKSAVRMPESEWKTIALGDLMPGRGETVDPANHPEENFDLYSIPAFDSRKPEELRGNQIGSTKQVVAPGDVLLSKIVPHIRRAWVVGEHRGKRMIASSEWIVFRDQRVSADFLRHILVADEFHAKFMSTVSGVGGSLLRARPAHVAKINIVLPPLAEQRRIAEVLDRAEALRAKRRAALAQLDSLTQSLFLDLFGDPATNPKKWPRTSLGELIKTGPQNGLYKPSSDYGSGTPILRIDAFYDGKVTALSALKRVRVSDSERTLFGLAADDIVINRVNSLEYLGKCALIPKLNEDTVFESNMMKFRVETSRIMPRFLVQFLQSGFVRGQIEMRAKHAVNQASINQQDVRGFTINLPPLPSNKPSPAASPRSSG